MTRALAAFAFVIGAVLLMAQVPANHPWQFGVFLGLCLVVGGGVVWLEGKER